MYLKPVLLNRLFKPKTFKKLTKKKHIIVIKEGKKGYNLLSAIKHNV